MKTIAIIGAGFSGTMLAVQLAGLVDSEVQIVLIERNEVARGIAYSEKNDECFLLNVRADHMGAYPDDTTHFFRWTQEKKLNVQHDSFLSRKTYGQYLEEQLLNHSSKIQILKKEVLDIDETKNIFFNDQTILKADKIVIATGLETPPFPENIPEGDILILGTGLSMVDAVIYLHKKKHSKKITAVSRHGWLPQLHKFFPAETARPVYDFRDNHSLGFVFESVRENLKRFDWHLVMDALRPHIQTLWKNFSLREKKQFLRWLRPLWNIHRHRMNPEHLLILQQMIKENRLEILSLKDINYEIPKHGFLIDCRGFAIEKNDLVENLIKRKLVKIDDLNLGLEVLAKEWLYTMGALRRGELWEITAVTEIRSEALALARLLVS